MKTRLALMLSGSLRKPAARRTRVVGRQPWLTKRFLTSASARVRTACTDAPLRAAGRFSQPKKYGCDMLPGSVVPQESNMKGTSISPSCE